MADAEHLITAIAALVGALAWPAVVAFIVWLFREQIAELLPFLKRIGPQGIEISREAEKLTSAVTRAEEEPITEAPSRSPAVPPGTITPPPEVPLPSELTPPIFDPNSPLPRMVTGVSHREEPYLRDAIVADPSAGIVLIAIQLERELRALAGQIGIPEFDRASVRQLTESLAPRGALGGDAKAAINQFWVVRNEVMHGGAILPHVVKSVAENGLALLRLVTAVPRERYLVHGTTALYSNEEMTDLVPDLRAVILNVYPPTGAMPRRTAFPTADYYLKGSLVSWTWDMSRIVGPVWCRDTTSDHRFAIERSALFAGRPVY